MLAFHTDKPRYFQYQYLTTRDYILHFLGTYLDTGRSLRVLEIGCAEAGVLKAFTELGHECVGIELSPSRVALAREFMKEEVEKGQISFLTDDIYDIDPMKQGMQFDLILLKDVIEHIPVQARFMQHLQGFLKPGGLVFFGFPPWYMPFGGHQQICGNKFLRMLPWMHLLPGFMYRGFLQLMGEKPEVVQELLSIKSTGISMERFQRIYARQGYVCLRRKAWLFNPIYRFKFGLKPRRLPGFLGSIPFFRNFYTTCAYYLLRGPK